MRRLVYAAAASILVMGAATDPSHAEVTFVFDQAPGKLPKTVRPAAYRIDIAPDLERLTFTGREAIDVDVRKPAAAITLNEAGLTLRSATLETGQTATISVDDKAQTATFTFAQAVSTGRHTLSIIYGGPILDTPNGLYYNDYKTPAGLSKRMLVTQFEVSDARRMFPSWDEPAFKATFQLSVTLPSAFAAVSNMPIASTTAAGPNAKHVVFATSPLMSSYLVALLAGDLSAVNGEAAGVQMSAWAPTGRESQAQYALDVEQQVLPYYNSYFSVPYPLPKLDLIAVPGNYLAGAMENWGAITFIDDAMLFDPQTSSAATRQVIYLDVAHEMAHQWSGDLVTMGWWDNIWLNEGFATWMENKATDHFNPTWEIWPRQHSDRERAMGQDALPTTHPVQQVIRDESEASSAFDDISYGKGGQVIRMIEDWIGPDVFRSGMRNYMRAHAYSNATSADLWAALGAAAHLDVATVAQSFTEQPGIPLVQVARSCAGGHPSITLTEGRFTIHDPGPKAETWTIPVTLGAPGAKPQHVLLTRTPVTLPIASCTTAVKLNMGESGYYRTQYDAPSLKALAGVLPSLQAADRADLLGDQFALFVAKRASLGAYLDLLGDLKDERNIAVWEDTIERLQQLDTVLQGSPKQKALDAYATRLITPEFVRLGWDAKLGENVLDTLLRPELITALGRFGDAPVIAEANRRFHAFVATPSSLPPSLRSAVLGIVGHTADQATYDTLRTLGVKATSTEEKLRYFMAMASASDPALIKQNVVFATSGEIQNARVATFIASISYTSDKPDLLYTLVEPVAKAIDAKAPEDGMQATALMAAASGSLNPNTAAILLAAPSSSTSSGARIQAARIADEIKANAELRGRAASELEAWRDRPRSDGLTPMV
jgi:aminopeptidase N